MWLDIDKDEEDEVARGNVSGAGFEMTVVGEEISEEAVETAVNEEGELEDNVVLVAAAVVVVLVPVATVKEEDERNEFIVKLSEELLDVNLVAPSAR